jgi:hypothetical protein
MPYPAYGETRCTGICNTHDAALVPSSCRNHIVVFQDEQHRRVQQDGTAGRLANRLLIVDSHVKSAHRPIIRFTVERCQHHGNPSRYADLSSGSAAPCRSGAATGHRNDPVSVSIPTRCHQTVLRYWLHISFGTTRRASTVSSEKEDNDGR